MSENNNTDIDDIDVSQIPFINTIWICKDCIEIILKTSAVLPVVIFGIFGNVMVIYILCKNIKLRTATNLLIGNMAVADLLSLAIHPWVVLTYDFFQNYQLGVIGCKGEGPAECSLLLASVVSMSAITYDRLTAIVLPKETRITKKRAKTLIAIMWIFGLVLSLPMVFNRTYKERQWLNFLEKYCSENLLVINIYWYVIITVMVWLPMIIQLICYISIFVKVINNGYPCTYEEFLSSNFFQKLLTFLSKRQRQYNSSKAGLLTEGVELPEATLSCKKDILYLFSREALLPKLDKYEKITLKKLNQHHMSYKKKAAITMFIVTIVFMICRLPLTGYIMYRHQLIKDKKITASASDVKFQEYNIEQKKEIQEYCYRKQKDPKRDGTLEEHNIWSREYNTLRNKQKR